ncbi:hypothetical protein CAPTEDRAFT_225956 [Capitella teleta]|uniref:BLOC-1 subunit 6 n=1 Tax=Capitella teleta TaxID=283909 RepID=R7TW30_CAPTE|nr:hypothetical protein CAPTEDRAFT_225956 [Capitella teleta]|eukprot:ELT98118.1 hypothetical protein CAPTEDRAFT_225956 [Capitella teleta]
MNRIWELLCCRLQERFQLLPIMEDDDQVEVAEEAVVGEVPQLSRSEDQHSALFDNIRAIDDRTVEKMTYGILAHLLPDLQKAQSTLSDMTENQRVLIESVQQENAKFAECQAMKDVTLMMDKAKLYQGKLQNIKKDMYAIRDKSLKLQKRALKLQQQREKESEQEEARRQRELERERQLIAKPVRKS